MIMREVNLIVSDMKKIILLATLLILYSSCVNTKGVMNGWVGETKQKLIKAWGPPIRILNNDKDGEVLVYAEQVFTNFNNGDGSKIAGPNYWNYEYIYVNKEGKIFSWKNEKQKLPPQAIDSNTLISSNLLTVK